jgi:hypothetical protein
VGRGARFFIGLAKNEAIGYVLDHHVNPTLDPAFEVAFSVRNAYRGARGAYRGLEGMRTLGRGERFGSGALGTRVAGQWFHGPSDRHFAIDAIDNTAAVLQADLATVPAAAQVWAKNTAAPALAAWRAFRDELLESTAALLATSWEAIDEWRDRIIALRDLIQVAGGTVAAPEVPELPRTLWERAQHGGGDRFDRWLTIARGAAYTTIAVMGVWGLVTALRGLRRVKIVERALAEPGTEEEITAQERAAAEIQHEAQT